MIRIMIDFETLALKENAVLLSLGACVFDPATGEIGQTFYAAIDPRTQPGRDISASTVVWWLNQDQAARDKILDAVAAADALAGGAEDESLYETAALPINHVAMAFNAWVESLGGDVECWSNGAVDHAWLNSMFEYSGFKNPIPFWKQRDYRTLKGLYPDVKAEDYGVAHNALDDAIKQSKHLCMLLPRTAKTDRLVELVVNGDGEDNEAYDIAESLSPAARAAIGVPGSGRARLQTAATTEPWCYCDQCEVAHHRAAEEDERCVSCGKFLTAVGVPEVDDGK